MTGRRLASPWRGALRRETSGPARRAALAVAGCLVALALTASVASASAPSATTEAASGVNYAMVTLNGTVNPNSQETAYKFEYGETTSYGASVPVEAMGIGKGSSNIKVSQTVKGLKVGPVYHFRLVATNASGTTYGADQTFATAGWMVKGRELESATAVTSKGTLAVAASPVKLLGGGQVTSECATAGEGTVGTAGNGEITKLTLSSCKVASSTNPICTVGSKVELKVNHLPWRTTLVTSAGATRELIAEGGKGAPKVEMECRSITITGSGNTSMAVSAVSGGVDQTFDAHSEELTWNGSVSKATLEGTQLIESPGAGTLTLGPLVGSWLTNGQPVNNPVPVSAKGETTFPLSVAPLFGGGSMHVKCSNAGEGKADEGGEGEDATFGFSECTANSSTVSWCPNNTAVQVRSLDLPWRTVLLTNAGETRELLLNGGKGVPGFEVECKGEVATASGATSMAVKDITGIGVEASFGEGAEGLGWSGFGSGRLEGALTLESSVGTLGVEAG